MEKDFHVLRKESVQMLLWRAVINSVLPKCIAVIVLRNAKLCLLYLWIILFQDTSLFILLNAFSCPNMISFVKPVILSVHVFMGNELFSERCLLKWENVMWNACVIYVHCKVFSNISIGSVWYWCIIYFTYTKGRNITNLANSEKQCVVQVLWVN